MWIRDQVLDIPCAVKCEFCRIDHIADQTVHEPNVEHITHIVYPQLIHESQGIISEVLIGRYLTTLMEEVLSE